VKEAIHLLLVALGMCSDVPGLIGVGHRLVATVPRRIRSRRCRDVPPEAAGVIRWLLVILGVGVGAEVWSVPQPTPVGVRGAGLDRDDVVAPKSASRSHPHMRGTN
jgi:hypothetical protein